MAIRLRFLTGRTALFLARVERGCCPRREASPVGLRDIGHAASTEQPRDDGSELGFQERSRPRGAQRSDPDPGPSGQGFFMGTTDAHWIGRTREIGEGAD